jgi:hypothetical protein
MIRGRDIIFISSIDWDDQWQAPQELALRLSKNGNRVLYIENTGIRTPGLRDTRRIIRRLKHGCVAGNILGQAKSFVGFRYAATPNGSVARNRVFSIIHFSVHSTSLQEAIN